MFWYKNYMHWNKQRSVIRINSFISKSLSFDQIKTTELTQEKLIITKNNGDRMTFDLNKIVGSDTQKLNQIIVENTITHPIYN